MWKQTWSWTSSEIQFHYHEERLLQRLMSIRRYLGLWPLAMVLLVAAWQTAIAEDPYFVTDHHHLPEAGNLAISNYSVLGTPKSGNGFLGSQMEFEYRIAKWWATQVQFDGQTTWNDSTIFTGYSWTNKFKLYPSNRWLNSAFVISWEDGNAADKSLAEIEGHGTEEDFALSNSVTKKIHEHEVEMKLIVSRDYKGWNFAWNFMTAKSLAAGPWKWGYSLGTNRPLSAADGNGHCVFCRRSMSAGLEFYGGLGDSSSFGPQRTPQYLGPEMSWKLSERAAVKAGPHFGLTPASQHVLMHFAVVYEIPHFNKSVRKILHGD